MVYFLYFVALVALSQSAIIVRFSHVHSPETIGFWRLALVSLLLALMGGVNLLMQPHPMRTWHELRRKLRGHYLSMALSGLAFGAHLWTYFLAAAHTSVSHCVVLFASNPIFVSAGAWFFYREKLSAKLLFSYFICLIGLVFLSTHTPLGKTTATEFGDIMALISALTFAAFALLGKAPRLAVGNWTYTGIVNFMGAGVFFVGATQKWLTSDEDGAFLHMGSRAWIAALLMAVFPSLLGHGVFMYCLKFMNLNLLSCGKLLEPALAILVGFLAFGEEIDRVTILSFALIAIGVLNLFWPIRMSKR